MNILEDRNVGILYLSTNFDNVDLHRNRRDRHIDTHTDTHTLKLILSGLVKKKRRKG